MSTSLNPYSIEWDKWIPTVKCALNAQVNSATGESPHYILFVQDKLLPYDMLSAEPSPVYNCDDFIAININKFQLIHSRVRKHMETYKEELKIKQHKLGKEVTLSIGQLVMAKLHVPVASSNKLSPKFTGPYNIVDKAGGNKFKIQNLKTLEVSIRHADDVKKVNMEVDLTASRQDIENEEIDAQTESDREDNDVIDDTDDTHEYRKKLRNYKERFIEKTSKVKVLTCNITELFLQDEFDDFVNTLLEELEVDINSFYR